MDRDKIKELVRLRVIEERLKEKGQPPLNPEDLRRILREVELELRATIDPRQHADLNALVGRTGDEVNKEEITRAAAREVREAREPSRWDAAIAIAEAAKAKAKAPEAPKEPISVEAVIRDDTRVGEFFENFYNPYAENLRL